MSDVTGRKRQSKGTPTGGQFAAENKPESGVDLSSSDGGVNMSYRELREMVIDYRRSTTSEEDREDMRTFWKERGIPNHIAAGMAASRAKDEARSRGKIVTAYPDDESPASGNAVWGNSGKPLTQVKVLHDSDGNASFHYHDDNRDLDAMRDRYENVISAADYVESMAGNRVDSEGADVPQPDARSSSGNAVWASGTDHQVKVLVTDEGPSVLPSSVHPGMTPADHRARAMNVIGALDYVEDLKRRS